MSDMCRLRTRLHASNLTSRYIPADRQASKALTAHWSRHGGAYDHRAQCYFQLLWHAAIWVTCNFRWWSRSNNDARARHNMHVTSQVALEGEIVTSSAPLLQWQRTVECAGRLRSSCAPQMCKIHGRDSNSGSQCPKVCNCQN